MKGAYMMCLLLNVLSKCYTKPSPRDTDHVHGQCTLYILDDTNFSIQKAVRMLLGKF